jgi:hypothetical protein
MSANVPAAAANAEKKNNAPVANAGKKNNAPAVNNAANAGKKNNAANAGKKNNAANAEKKNNAPAANAGKKNNAANAAANGNATNSGDNAAIPRHASVEKIEVSAKKLKELVDKDGTNCAALKEQAKKVIDDSSEVDNALKKDEVKEQNLKSVTTLLKEIIDPIAKACKTNAKAAPATASPAANATAAPAANATAAPAANATAAPKMEGGRRKTKTRKSKRKGKSRRRM